MNEDYLVKFIISELRVILNEKYFGEHKLDQETILFGENSILDSLDLVSLIVKVEEHILDNTNQEIQIIDEDSIINDGNTPFRNALTLANIILEKLNEK